MTTVRKWKGLVVLSLLLVGQVSAWASQDCPPGTFLRKIGSVVTANDTTGASVGVDAVTDTAAEVRAVRVSCGSTACVAGLYDSDAGDGLEAGETDNADVLDEPGAIANSSSWTYYEPPLKFDTGVTFRDDGNVSALILYGCR